MIWIEMSIDKVHGGEGWGFTECLWSPAYRLVNEKKEKWGYWETVYNVRAGDIILHLRGEGINCKLVGHSIASTNGFITKSKPAVLGSNWSYANEFYRVNLKDYEEFESQIFLEEIFRMYKEKLTNYYDQNRDKKQKRKLFYVIQNNKLQKQNGAYLSEIDNELFNILFPNVYGERVEENQNEYGKPNINSTVGEVERVVKTRKGQSEFSTKVKENFKDKCCFPTCNISDLDFLVGAHISRWADDPDSRGNTSNGLCLCLFHDKAFEKGLFTLDTEFRVRLNKEILDSYSDEIKNGLNADGCEINTHIIPIGEEFLEKHWSRIGFKPK